jgi:hypothetical protein
LNSVDCDGVGCFDTLIFENHTAVSPPGGTRLAVLFKIATRDYSPNATIDVVHGAAGDGNTHMYAEISARFPLSCLTKRHVLRGV